MLVGAAPSVADLRFLVMRNLERFTCEIIDPFFLAILQRREEEVINRVVPESLRKRRGTYVVRHQWLGFRFSRQTAICIVSAAKTHKRPCAQSIGKQARPLGGGNWERIERVIRRSV
jgi:hypothetical protein